MSTEETKHVHVGLFSNIRHKALKAAKKCKARHYVNAKMTEWRVFPDTLVTLSSYGFTSKAGFLRDKIEEMDNNEWIVCPVQLNENSSSMWDIQIGVTGKCKIGQEPYESMLLELEEELGLRCVNKIQGTHFINGVQERTIFKIHVESTLPIEKDDMPISGSSEKELLDKKIACLIHGSFEDVERVINKSKKNRYYSCNNDNIIGIAFVSVETIKQRFCR
jgi:hypothetical protein